MTYNQWLDKLIEEKGIDRDDFFEIGDNIFEYGYVIDCIKLAPAHEKEAIRKMLVKIDFVNGDIKHYLRHLAHALI